MSGATWLLTDPLGAYSLEREPPDWVPGVRTTGLSAAKTPSPRAGPTCSKCDPSSLATLSRGPARLGCPHASPKPGQGNKRNQYIAEPTGAPRPSGRPQRPGGPRSPGSPWRSVKKQGRRRSSRPAWVPRAPRRRARRAHSSRGSPACPRLWNCRLSKSNLICFIEIGHPRSQTGTRADL